MRSVKAAFKEVGVSVFSSFWVIQQVCKESFGCSICVDTEISRNSIWHLLSSHILFLWLLGNQDPCSINYLDKPSICELIHDDITFDIPFAKNTHMNQTSMPLLSLRSTIQGWLTNISPLSSSTQTFFSMMGLYGGLWEQPGTYPPLWNLHLRIFRDNAGRVHVTQLQCVEHSLSWDAWLPEASISQYDSLAFLLFCGLNSLPTRLHLFMVARTDHCNQTLVDILQDKAYSPMTYSNDVFSTQSLMPTTSWNHSIQFTGLIHLSVFGKHFLMSPNDINWLNVKFNLFTPPKQTKILGEIFI